jgi:pimeloyl-ACP methyl ester carboxylesterase
MPAFATAAFEPSGRSRGLGHARQPKQGYDTGRVATDLRALMRQLGHKRYAVAGHGM